MRGEDAHRQSRAGDSKVAAYVDLPSPAECPHSEIELHIADDTGPHYRVIRLRKAYRPFTWDIWVPVPFTSPPYVIPPEREDIDAAWLAAYEKMGRYWREDCTTDFVHNYKLPTGRWITVKLRRDRGEALHAVWEDEAGWVW